MSKKAGEIVILLRAEHARYVSDINTAIARNTEFGQSAKVAGAQAAAGANEATAAVHKTIAAGVEGAAALATALGTLSAGVAKYAAANGAGVSTTQELANTYRALRIALSPTPFTVATIATTLLVEETIRLTNSRAKLIEQQSLIAAVNKQSFYSVEAIDAASKISGKDPSAIRSAYLEWRSRAETNAPEVRAGLNTLGISGGGTLTEIAKAFTEIEDPVKRARAAVLIFGDQAGVALQQLDGKFVNGMTAVKDYGLTLDEISRNQIYRFRQDFLNLKTTITDFSSLSGWWESFKQGTEVVAAAADDMAKRGIGAIDKFIEKYAAGLHAGYSVTIGQLKDPTGGLDIPKPDSRAENIQAAVLAGDIFAQERAARLRQADTLEGKKETAADAKKRSDAAYQSLQDDARRRQENPSDPTLLSGTARLLLATQAQSAASLAKATGEVVKSMEDAERAAKEAADFQKKAPERLKALAEATRNREITTPIASEILRASSDVTRDADKTALGEKQARAAIATEGIQAVVRREQDKFGREWEKSLGEAEAARQKLFSENIRQQMEIDTRIVEAGREIAKLLVREDTAKIAGIRSGAEHESRMAGIQAAPGEELALAQRQLEIRLQSLAAERSIIEAHRDDYDMEEEEERLSKEFQAANLSYQEEIAAHVKQVSQQALNAGGAYQQQLRLIQEQQTALGNVVVTEKNALDIAFARKQLENERLRILAQQALALGHASDGVRAFFLDMQQQGRTTANTIYDALHSALDKLSNNFTELITGGKTNFGQAFKDIGKQMVNDTIHQGMQKGLGAIGKAIGFNIPGLTAKRDGSDPSLALWVQLVGAGGAGSVPGSVLGGSLGKLGPIFGGSQGGGVFNFLGKAAKTIGGLLGGSAGPEFSTDSSISFDGFRAAGGPVSPGSAYWVGESGPEPFIPKSAGTILSNADARRMASAGDTHHYSIDVAAGVSRQEMYQAVLAAHKASVRGGVEANIEFQKRLPRKS